MNWQEKSAEFAAEHNLKHAPQIHLIDLLSELGEVAKELLKGSNYGEQPLTLRDEMTSELGDTLYSLCLLAESLDIDLDTALSETLLKYERRWQNTGSVDSGQ